MDWYGYVILAFLVIIFFIIQSVSARKRKNENLEKQIKESWGKKNKREYTHNEYERIRKYFDAKCGQFSIDDITWNDLGMDNVFMDMNNTMSSVGEENLYRILRDITFDSKELQKRDRIADYFIKHNDEGIKIEKIFSKIGRSKSISLYEFIHRLGEVKCENGIRHFIHPVLIIISLISFFASPEIGIAALILSITVNVIAYYRYKGEIENYFVCFKYLISMVDGAGEIAELNIAGIEEYNNDLKYIFDRLKPVFKCVGLLTTNSMGGSIGEIIMDYVRIITHVDIIAFNSMVKNVKKNQENIDLLYEKLGQVEAYYAIGSYRAFLRNNTGYYCKPEFTKTRELHGVSVYHPLINNPVANSVYTKKGVLLTGSNASGKSTFLKTIAINGILAQSVYTCTAEKFLMNNCLIMSSMALKDNLENNESYYIVEIKSLKRILDKKQQNVNILCFVDEVLRGTNTVERIAASSEILKSLDADNIICFAATHDIELTHILENIYNNFHFREEVKDNDIIFDYKLNEGRAVTRNAIKLLGIMGYENKIIQSAENLAIKFLETGNW